MTSALSPVLQQNTDAHNTDSCIASSMPKHDTLKYLADMLRELSAMSPGPNSKMQESILTPHSGMSKLQQAQCFQRVSLLISLSNGPYSVFSILPALARGLESSRRRDKSYRRLRLSRRDALYFF